MFSRLRKLPLLMLAALAVFGLSACGDSHTKVTTGTYAGEAGKAAPYLNVGPLLYEVQISRQLNPFNHEDASYLQGVGASEAQLEPGQEWFGVFVQVYNISNAPHLDANDFTITDTQNNAYTPLVLGGANQYAYRQGIVGGKNQVPKLGTVADDFGPQGALLLYKIQTESLENRPLELKITDPEDSSESASVTLDV
jgi:hypothetical protein